MELNKRAVEDPVLELVALAADALALKDALEAHVARLDTVATEATDRYGQTIRPTIVAYLASIDRCTSILTTLAKLDLGERVARLQIEQLRLLTMVLTGVVTKLGHDANDPTVRQVIANQLRLVSGDGA